MIPIAIAVVERDGAFLIGQRSGGQSLAGYWEFPGGRVEAGETAEEAAVRECREEAGLTIEVVSEYDSREQRYDFGEVALRFFACRWIGGNETPRAPFRWVMREALAEYPFPAGNQELLERLLG